MQDCGDCGVKPGELHVAGCDCERCPRCGCQQIGCDCIYEVNGLDVDDLEADNPDVYENGPTEAMYAKWDAEWGHRRLPWAGEFPGSAECREFGLWARAVAGKGWVPCGPDAPGATEDLNRLNGWHGFRWDADEGRWVRAS